MNFNIKSLSLQSIINFCRTTLTVATAETISWIGIVLVHAATIPTMISIMSGLTDKMPPVDFVMFVWAGLSLLFVRAIILKDMLHIVTIGTGFIVHATLMALILFK
jgi:hypothetical protein